MIATVPCPRHKPGYAPSAAEHCFPAGESRKGVSYGVQQHFCLSHGHGHGVLRADLPDCVDLSHERRGKKAAPAPVPAAPQTAGEVTPELVAAVSAALAEELGTDITGIRIVSMKKV